MTIRFVLEKEDLNAFSDHIRRNHPNFRRSKLFSCLIFLCLSFFLAITINGSLLFRIVYFVLFMVLLTGVSFLLNFIMRSVIPMFPSKPGDGILCEHTVSLTDEGVLEETAVNKSTQLWRGMYEIVDAPRHLFLFTQSNAAIIVPKRSFSDLESMQAFLQRANMLFEQAKSQFSAGRESV